MLSPFAWFLCLCNNLQQQRYVDKMIFFYILKGNKMFLFTIGLGKIESVKHMNVS